MVRLKAKGDNSYVTMARIPDERAQAETNVMMLAFREAVDNLLETVVTAGKSTKAEENVLARFIFLKKLQEDMQTDMDRVTMVLDVVKQKLTSIGAL